MITVALLTLVALGLTVVFLLGHLKRLTATLTRVADQLQPTLEELSRDTAVTQAELQRVADAAQRLTSEREA